MQTLLSAIYATATATPSRPALLFVRGGTSYVQFSYADVIRETERWAARFLRVPLARGAIVCIVLDHRFDMYFAYLGAMRAGCVPTFLAYPTQKQREDVYWPALAGYFDHVEPDCIVTYAAAHRRVAALVNDPGRALIDIDEFGPDDPCSLPPLASVEDESMLALLQNSSGTTGAKKTVALTYGAIRLQAAALETALAATANDRTVSWLPLYHDMGLFTAFLFPLSMGSSVISFDAFDWLARPALFFELVERFRATHAWLPNFALNHLVRTCGDLERADLSTLRALVSTSEPCKPATFDAFVAAFEPHGFSPVALRASYGMAEAVFACTLTDADLPPRRLTVAANGAGISYLSSGRPLPGLDVRVVASEGSNVGEIAIRGAFVVRGYHADVTQTASFDDGWFFTGDIGFLNEGEIFICGRTKEVLIVHGRNFFANDLEAIADGVDGTKPGRNVAFSMFDEVTASEEAVVLLESELTVASERAALTRSVRAAIFNSLGLHVKWVTIVAPGELRKTTSGKMSRSENAAAFARTFVVPVPKR